MRKAEFTFSVVIPAYNEELYLPDTLNALCRAMAASEYKGEIIVVDNNSTDQTAETARRFGSRVVFEKFNQISRARNTGARHARGRCLIFMDADTRVSPELLESALARIAGGRAAGGGATVAPDRPVGQTYRLALNLWNRFSVTFGIAAGCFIFCLRKGFEAVGGFSEKVYVGEEVWFSRDYGRWAKSQNLSFDVIAHLPAITSTRKLEWYSGGQNVVLLISMFFFPLIMRHRRLCRFWYRRPPAAD